MDEEIEAGDTVLFKDGDAHWSVKSIVEWVPNPKKSLVHLVSQLSGRTRTAHLSQLRLHSKGTGNA